MSEETNTTQNNMNNFIKNIMQQLQPKQSDAENEVDVEEETETETENDSDSQGEEQTTRRKSDQDSNYSCEEYSNEWEALLKLLDSHKKLCQSFLLLCKKTKH